MSVQMCYTRGKTYACNNNTDNWFENVRKLKPHIYYALGEWHVVVCGTLMNGYDEICCERNEKAKLWMMVRNGEKNGSNALIRAELSKLGHFFKKRAE